jgi:exonuclease III
MKIATFNINGIKARIEALTAWLDAAQPDVALLQEIKSVDEGFPRELFEDRGYNVETHGQKGFNGVAVLSKYPLEDVSRGLPGTHPTTRPAGSRPRSWAATQSASAGSTCRTATPRRGPSTTTSSPGWKG